MKRTKQYPRVWFDVPSIKKIISEIQAIVKKPSDTKFNTFIIERDGEKWDYETSPSKRSDKGSENQNSFCA